MGRTKDPDYQKKYWESCKVDWVCIVCGNKYSSVRESQTCSPACRGKLKSTNYTKELTCTECGKTFSRKMSDIKNGRDKTCSVACQRKRHSRTVVGENHHRWRNAKEEFKCIICGEIFKSYKSPNKKKNRMCSMECKYIYISRALTGENHYLWVGGCEAYRGAGWQKIRATILARDNYACQECGKTVEEELMDFARDLSVHHIIPFRFFGEDHARANQPENLVTLCATCHTGQDSHRWKEVGKICQRSLDSG